MSRYGEVGSSAGEFAREPGARRKKLAGYLKAANELRQSYQESYTQQWNTRRERAADGTESPAESFSNVAIVRSGEEEMILFPSYARKHVKTKPKAEPGTIQEVGGTGRDYRDTVGSGDAEYWKQQWDKYEDDNAVVDVDVRGWIYTPHRGQMTRKHRIFVGLARQLVGLPANPRPASQVSPTDSRNTSPHASIREKLENRTTKQEEDYVSKEAEAIVRRGEAEADAAGRGDYSEMPRKDSDSSSLHRQDTQSSSGRKMSSNSDPSLRHRQSNTSMRSDLDSPIPGIRKRESWNQPANMSADELTTANAHLMDRLKPFLANPLANSPISAFFYNDKVSRQKTTMTDASGQFALRAALDFVPTHVRVLASDKLSATEEVIITAPHGVSLISDIDDTIKHSAIGSGAREIFRNAFIRDLRDLTIEGVKEWYNKLAEMGVKIHYVSNSPWQLYPVLSSFFAMAGLPPGSFHLKQYSGMMQGIFEPVAERKKSTLDRISRDFPERRFILVGDSGEADLEVYTDFVLDNPGRVLGIFIRDVTTPIPKGFFDSSMGSLTGETSSSRRNGSAPSRAYHTSTSPGHGNGEYDPELEAAIAASLKDMEDVERRRVDGGLASRSTAPGLHTYHSDHPEMRPKLPQRRPSEPPAPESRRMEPPMGMLIDIGEEQEPTSTSSPVIARSHSDTNLAGMRRVSTGSLTKSGPPARPTKPSNLRSSISRSPEPEEERQFQRPPPPPKPRRLSSQSRQQTQPQDVRLPPSPAPSSSSSQIQKKPAPPPPPSRNDSSWRQRNGLTSTNIVTAASNYWYGSPQNDLASPAPSQPSRNLSSATPSPSTPTAQSPSQASAKNPPPQPPRRAISSYPAAAAQYASNRVSSAWSSTSSNNSSFAANGTNNGAGNGDGQGLNKKEEMWRRRWARAEEIMRRQKPPVVLRTWRVGSDVMEETVRMVRGEMERVGRLEGEGKKKSEE